MSGHRSPPPLSTTIMTPGVISPQPRGSHPVPYCFTEAVAVSLRDERGRVAEVVHIPGRRVVRASAESDAIGPGREILNRGAEAEELHSAIGKRKIEDPRSGLTQRALAVHVTN